MLALPASTSTSTCSYAMFCECFVIILYLVVYIFCFRLIIIIGGSDSHSSAILVMLSVEYVSFHVGLFFVPTGNTYNALKTAQSIMDKSCEEIISTLSAVGWVTSHVLLGAGEWRYSWSPDKDT